MSDHYSFVSLTSESPYAQLFHVVDNITQKPVALLHNVPNASKDPNPENRQHWALTRLKDRAYMAPWDYSKRISLESVQRRVQSISPEKFGAEEGQFIAMAMTRCGFCGPISGTGDFLTFDSLPIGDDDYSSPDFSLLHAQLVLSALENGIVVMGLVSGDVITKAWIVDYPTHEHVFSEQMYNRQST